MLEWLKRHAWKACSRQNRLAGSNPVLSAMQKGCNGRYIPFFSCLSARPHLRNHGAQAAQQNVFPIRIFYPEKTSIPSAKQSIYLYINWLQVYSLRLQPVTGDGLGIILNVPPHQWQSAFPSEQIITITGIIFTPCLKVFAISKLMFPIIREKVYYKVCNTYYKVCNMRYKVCNIY